MRCLGFHHVYDLLNHAALDNYFLPKPIYNLPLQAENFRDAKPQAELLNDAKSLLVPY